MAKGGFKGGYGGGFSGGGKNQANLMKQAQKMQEDLQKMQEQLEASRFSASSGGGAVKATVSGKHELTALEIDPSAVDPEDVDMLQDMIIAAVNEAMRKVEDASASRMSKLSGINGLPF